MTHTLPKHATLPLWKDKTIAEKIETVNSMSATANIYAENKGKTIDCSITVPSDSDLDLLNERMLRLYSNILNDDNQKIANSLNLCNHFDDAEKIDILRTQEFIKQNPNALNMNCESGHVTGSGLVFDRDARKVLLHKHKKLGIWLQFGGHLDFETVVSDSALRECTEESGLQDLKLASIYNDVSIPIDVEVQRIPEKKGQPEHDHYDFRYLFETKSPDKVFAQEGESDSFWWVDINEALMIDDRLISPPLKRLINKSKIYLELK